jgi:hypothetical protein
MKRKFLPAFVLLFGLQLPVLPAATAQSKLPLLQKGAAPATPKVSIDWNQRLDYAALTDICRQLAKAYPNLVQLETIGNTYEGRRIWALTISDFRTGDPERKPAYYLDGSIFSHADQTPENALYTAWYLLENYSQEPFIQELLLQKTLYILPSVFPDALEKQNAILKATNASRLGLAYFDDDNDGLVDEDQPEDINQDGFITYMRRKSPQGHFVIDPKNPHKLIPVKPGQKGEFELLGLEGFDSDGDGAVNEDPPGYQDANSDWAWNWQPEHLKGHASRYPFSLPENRVVKDFILKHPNIAAAQNYYHHASLSTGQHTGQKEDLYQTEENQLKANLAELTEVLLPEYPKAAGVLQAYNVFGGQMEWLRAARGIVTFRNELGSGPINQEYALAPNQDQEQRQVGSQPLGKDAYLEWIPFNHPTLGAIEIGGPMYHYSLGHADGNLQEAGAHWNLLFTLLQAYHTPQIEIKDVEVKPLANGFSEVRATVVNTRLMPTHSAHDVRNKIERPDYITLKDSTVVAGSFKVSEGEGAFVEQTYIPARLEVPTIPGKGAVQVRWVVKSAQPILEIEVDSRKGGTVCQRF